MVQHRRGDEGSVLPALVVAVLGLVAFTLFTMVPLGSAADERAKARTAADAGALAAATQVRFNLEPLYAELADLPRAGPRPTPGDIASRLLRGACDEALRYAVRNGAAGSSVQCARSGMWEFTVSVRMAQPIEDTTQYASATATARLDAPGLRIGSSGLCVDLPAGGELCLPRPPEPPEPPAPPGPPGPPGRPPAPEPELPPLPELDVVLVE
jgi:hypothetical protein